MADSVTQTVRELLGDDFSRCESPSLRLEKYVHVGGDSKKGEINAVIATHRANAKPVPVLKPKGAVPFVAKLRSRLIVNQAGGILENAGLCLHSHFGAPFIPGSAVKGVARHAAWCEWMEAKDAHDESKADDIAKRMAEVFGYPTNDAGLDAYLAAREWKDKASSGSVAFLAAVPTDSGRLALDIVNCHHPKYYAGNMPDATDNESPNPQFFPAVETGTEFVFSLVPVRPNADLASARDWLVRALSENGAGGKTAAGYGWFDCDPSYTDSWNKACQTAAKAAEKEALKTKWELRLEELDSHPEKLTSPVLKSLEKDLMALEDSSFRDANIGALNLLKKKLPEESPLDAMRGVWETQPRNGVIGTFIRGFSHLPEDRQKVIVELLREPSGIGADLWTFLKTDKKCQKGDIAAAVGLIRAFSKTHFNPPKMP